MSRRMAVVLSVVVGACTSPVSESSKALTDPALTGPEIMTLYSGNTVKSVKGSPWVEFYDPSGTVRGTASSGTYEGSWRVEGDKICIDMRTYDYEDCLVVRQKGTEYELSGEETKPVTVTVTSGNVQGL